LNLAVASTMGTALSNMERQVKGLAVVHFSSIEFDFKSFIAGGLSRVYFGKCLQKDVAIKVLFAIELTPKVVTDFYNEVQVMYDLQHDNIVKCLGISVMPPTICVILEYCHYGSLYDYIYNGSETSAADSTSTDTHLSLKSLKKANTEEAVSMTTTAPPRHTIHSIELVDGIGNSDGNVTSGGILNPLRAESNYRKSSSAIDNEAGMIRTHTF
jgi:serine/threonine protein kinase